MRLLPVGDTGLLLDCLDADEAAAWHAALAPQADAVRGASTVLLRGRPQDLRRLVAATEPTTPPEPHSADLARIAVRYDGPDLDEVARLTGLSAAEVVTAHTGTDWTVEFAGFAPGFAYLSGGDARLSVPRRGTPRTQVPAGSVGLAGPYSGVYPRASPGGWQLIGTTDAPLWDLERDPPALLRPGARVRFEAVT